MYGQLILDKHTNGEYINGERLFSLINGTGNRVHLQKNEIGPLSYTNYKNQLKISVRPETVFFKYFQIKVL